MGRSRPAANTITDWSLGGTIGSTANNIIVFYWTEGTAAQNVTLDQRWYLAEGDASAEVTAGGDPFARRHIVEETALCFRYYWRWSGSQFTRLAYAYADQTTNLIVVMYPPMSVLRTSPAVTASSLTANGTTITAVGFSGLSGGVMLLQATSSGLTVGNFYQLYVAASSTGVLALDAEL